jgi:hypothetical protein
MGTSGIDTGHNVTRATLGYLTLLKALESRIGLSYEELLVRRIVYHLGSAGNAVNA